VINIKFNKLCYILNFLMVVLFLNFMDDVCANNLNCQKNLLAMKYHNTMFHTKKQFAPSLLINHCSIVTKSPANDTVKYPEINIHGTVNSKLQIALKKNNDLNKARFTHKLQYPNIELDMISKLNSWINSEIGFIYHSHAKSFSVYPEIIVDKAFVTIGNVKKFPFYVTLGQFTPPFASVASSDMLTTSITKLLTAMENKHILMFGMRKNKMYIQSYIFQDRFHIIPINFLENSGLNVGYDLLAHSNLKMGIIIGILNDNTKTNFAKKYISELNNLDSINTNNSKRREINSFPVINSKTYLVYKNINFNINYVRSGRIFNLSTNNHDNTNHHCALQVESSIHFNTLNQQSKISMGYEQNLSDRRTIEDIPNYILFSTYSMTITKNSTLKLEYRHDVNINKKHNNFVTLNLGIHY